MTTSQQRVVVALCLVVVAFLNVDGLGNQKQKQTARNRPTAPTLDYSKFSHSTKKHQAACDTCHKIPTLRWQQTSTYPDITDYPGHDACVSCHRPQFFKGAKPVICSVCHVKTSPRDEARLSFRNPGVKLEFTIEFPHDRHQDVIALLNFRGSKASLNAVLGAQASAPARVQLERDWETSRRGRLRSQDEYLAAHARQISSADDKLPTY